MSSPNMNNFILVGAILAFSSIIFGGTGSVLVNSFILLAMCKVRTSPFSAASIWDASVGSTDRRKRRVRCIDRQY